MIDYIFITIFYISPSYHVLPCITVFTTSCITIRNLRIFITVYSIYYKMVFSFFAIYSIYSIYYGGNL